MPTEKVAITIEAMENIESAWRSRANTQNYNPKSAAYRTAECEFFVGAMAALDQCGIVMPPKWVINIMSGRPVAS